MHTCNQHMLPSGTCTEHYICTGVSNTKHEVKSHQVSVIQCFIHVLHRIEATVVQSKICVTSLSWRLVSNAHNSLNNKDFTEDRQGAVGF
jgi:hypothetical protein